jgi:xanthine dehydrogenase YagS FAD-binding subunit
MRPFDYASPTTADQVTAMLGKSWGEVEILAGGSDLLSLMKDEITTPKRLVNIKTVEGLHAISTEQGALHLGALVTLDRISAASTAQHNFPMLAGAAGDAASPQIRNVATIGGNLCQRPRCWYFRRAVPCLKNGGTSCPAVDGENQYLAILDNGPCHIVHPSDPAVALTALDAVVEVGSLAGRRLVPMGEFYVLPTQRLDQETVLAPGEFVSAIVLPASSANGVQRYHKLMQRDAWDFALVSIAGCRRANGDVRIVLGGVAPRPWRVNSSIEEDVASGGLDDDTISILADRALYDATPLAKNRYKVDLASSLLRQVMRELSADL